jgi:inner membrane transporter RhtA
VFESRRGRQAWIRMLKTSASPQILIAVFAVIGAMVSLGIGASVAKTLFVELGPLGVSAYRIGIGALILLVWFRPWRWRTDRQAWLRILPYGLSLALMNMAFFTAIQTLPIGVAIAIEFTGPLALSLFASKRAIDLIWVALAIVGLLLLSPLVNPDTSLDPKGVAFALLAGGFWASYIVMGRRASHLMPGQATALGMGVAAMIALPFGVAQAGLNLLDPGLLIAGLTIGILSSALPYTLEMFALRRLPIKTFGVILSIEPAFGAIAGAIILGEIMNHGQWLAIACIMAASAGCTATALRNAKTSTVNKKPRGAKT